ncbi:MAG: threonine aldolase family protein [Christensenellales bacterium]
MYSFENDYSEGAHQRILGALSRTNMEQARGYGEDMYTAKAIGLIKQKLEYPEAEIYFLSGGTQTNLIAISAFLKSYEAVVSASTGHIHIHEAGAIEATGHKILTVDSPDGKVTPASIQPVLDQHTDEHMVKPKLVYISNTTELGCAYTKNELTALSRYCKSKDLYLYLDGARLGSALCSQGNDVSLSDLSRLADAFYIGGTKNGALFGESLVLCNHILGNDCRYHIKQKGGLLAKGRMLGIQFYELFADDLFFDLARHANKMASIMKESMQNAGFQFLSDSNTNQLFPILPNWIIGELKKEYRFHSWSKIDENHSCIRLVTSWATIEEEVKKFAGFIDKVMLKPVP